MTTTATIEVEVQVEYTYHSACRGARDSLGGIRGAGPPLEPDEDEYVELSSVKFNGQEVELTEQQQEQIEQECLEHATEDPRY